jgi:hypothetical protein
MALAATPEPSSFAFLIIGLGALAMLARRKRRPAIALEK